MADAIAEALAHTDLLYTRSTSTASTPPTCPAPELPNRGYDHRSAADGP